MRRTKYYKCCKGCDFMPDYHYSDFSDYASGQITRLDAPSEFINTNSLNMDYNNLMKFTGYYDNRYVDPFVTGYAFIFVTKPSLFIDPEKNGGQTQHGALAYENMERDPYFTQFLTTEALNSMDVDIVKLLSYNPKYRKTNFLPILTNRFKNIQGGNIQIKPTQEFMTKKGYHIPLPNNIDDSALPGTLAISIPETSNLDITKMMGLWVNYMQNVSEGIFNPNPDCVKNGVLDYMSSIYYFVLNPDGKTIKYWVKYTGCYPLEIPSSSLQYTRGSSENVELNLNFQYTLKEEMNPDILKEFNLISLNFAGLDQYGNDITDNHSAIKNSKFLNISGLKTIANDILTSVDRDPIIYYKTGNTSGLFTGEYTTSTFELSFGRSSFTNAFSNKSYGNPYFQDLDDFIKTDLD